MRSLTRAAAAAVLWAGVSLGCPLYEPTYPLVRDFDGAGVEIGGAGAPWQAVAFQFRPQRSTPLSAIQILLTCLEPEDGGAGCDFLVELREDENGLPGREMALQPTPRFYREQLYWISVAILSGARGQWDYLAFVEELRGRMAFLSSQAGGGWVVEEDARHPAFLLWGIPEPGTGWLAGAALWVVWRARRSRLH